MVTYYDDNYGHWHDMDNPDTRAFYWQTQKNSVWKRCQSCGRKVKLRRDYAICNSCADKAENGMEY